MESTGTPLWILLDIEGTTTPIDFVHKTLFPFARENVEAFLSRHGQEPDVVNAIRALGEQQRADEAEELAPPPLASDPETRELVRYVHWLMDADRKVTALKALQGQLWQRGYRDGRLKGEVFPDVAPSLSRWTAAAINVAIYSSGSVLAQRLLFSNASGGDLTPYLSDYFDTRVGAKREPASYQEIARRLKCESRRILFVSDVSAELDAAREAGIDTRLSVRPGNAAQPADHGHVSVASFDELTF